MCSRLLLIAQLASLAIRMWVGGTWPGWMYFGESAVGAVLWPLISWLLLAPQRRPTDRDETRPTTLSFAMATPSRVHSKISWSGRLGAARRQPLRARSAAREQSHRATPHRSSHLNALKSARLHRTSKLHYYCERCPL